jgi:hypothetical protein
VRAALEGVVDRDGIGDVDLQRVRSPSLLAAYADEPELGVLNLDLRQALWDSITSTLLGTLPRP